MGQLFPDRIPGCEVEDREAESTEWEAGGDIGCKVMLYVTCNEDLGIWTFLAIIHRPYLADKRLGRTN